MADVIKLSSAAALEIWEIPVLFEDEFLLALNKPGLLLVSPDRNDAQRPSLMQLLQAAIERSAPPGWVRQRSLTYLRNAHRLDFETSGVILFAKTKPVLTALANLFGSEKLNQIYVALIHGTPLENSFTVDAKLAPHLAKAGVMRVDEKQGKRSRTEFQVRERFANCTVMECRPHTGRAHQIRVHLQHAGWPIVGDAMYGGAPLLLSRLKPEYRLKPNKTERPLISHAALHAEQLRLAHPVTGSELQITAPWPRDLTVAVKYLRRYAQEHS